VAIEGYHPQVLIKRALILFLGVTLISSLTPQSFARETLEQVRARVIALQEDAAEAGEGAQAAKVQLANLQKQLSSVKAQEADQRASVEGLRRSLGAIASSQYMSGGLSQSLELLFSADPTLYLSSAGSLETVTRKKAAQLRKYSVAKQRLEATSLTVSQKVAIVKATELRLQKQASLAQAKLKEAEALLAKLRSQDRARLEARNKKEQDQAEKKSRAAAQSLTRVSGRGGIAIKYALNQIGDSYVFGAAGPIKWDCSGLTMRSFQAAGVSLPHSSRLQFARGKSVSRSALVPGDLVFFGRPISHVGIYVGKDRMVHAPRPGARVQVVSFGAWFGRKPYVGARRL
jgi:cell wall-associated NlpC family hydrolase